MNWLLLGRSSTAHSHFAVSIYCLILEMKRRTFEVQGLGGPEWAGVLEVQQSARAVLGHGLAFLQARDPVLGVSLKSSASLPTAQHLAGAAGRRELFSIAQV